MKSDFKALVVRHVGGNKYERKIEARSINDLPPGDILVRVKYSSLNYKDGLSCIGNKGITRHYPHTPGIDAVGVIECSNSRFFNKGEKVVVVGTELGMNIPGGFGQFIRIPSTWAMPLPDGISMYQSMIFGTAGYTAALSVSALIKNGITIDGGPILVTGATGGVGSLSISVLSKLGYNVIATTGKLESESYLTNIGANHVYGREYVIDKLGRNLLKETWSAAIDTVGGITLSTLLKGCKPNGCVVATGMVSSNEINSTIFPFILRGISLIGINAQGTDIRTKKAIWKKLSREWFPSNIDQIANNCSLDGLNTYIEKIIDGNHIGRTVVKMD